MADAPTENQLFLKNAHTGINNVNGGLIASLVGVSYQAGTFQFDDPSTIFLDMRGREEFAVWFRNDDAAARVQILGTRKEFSDPSELEEDDFTDQAKNGIIVLGETDAVVGQTFQQYVSLDDPDLSDPVLTGAFPRRVSKITTAVIVQLRKTTGGAPPNVIAFGQVRAR